jgi:hypothetical protein
MHICKHTANFFEYRHQFIFIYEYIFIGWVDPSDKEKGGGDRDRVSIFGPLYTSCIQTNRKRRNDFIIGLLKRSAQIIQVCIYKCTYIYIPICMYII